MNNLNDDIAEAKRRLPLPKLMERLGLSAHAKNSARCPWHKDGNKSFSVWQGEKGWQFKCHAGCGHGDEVTCLEKHLGLSPKEAIKRFLEMAGLDSERATDAGSNMKPANTTGTTNPSKPASAAQAFDWRASVEAFTDADVANVAKWRGYTPALVQWLREKKIIGIHDGCLAFPVQDNAAVVVAAHYRIEGDGSWRFAPKGARVQPLVIGDLTTARSVHVFESQWDAFAVCDKLNMHSTPGFAVIVTRGASNGALVAGLVRPDAELHAWPQNDPVEKRDAKTGLTPAEKWLKTVAANAGCRVRAAVTPPEHKDANDWTRAGATDDDLLAATGGARIIAEKPRALIEFRTPSQLKAFVPPAGAVLVGDFHLVRGAASVIGGAPGVGKSRGGVALAEAGATGMDWFGLKVHRKFKTMIIQNENGEHRLKSEFSELDTQVLDPWVRVCPPPPYGLTFDSPEFCEVLIGAIDDFTPDVIVLDPWNAVARDDKAADYLETFRLIRSVIPAGDDAPALVIIAHTRKPKAEERTSGRGLLNTLAGSYALGSVPRCVFVMQAASDEPEDDRVVWTCCKNNDGELGARSAWVRRNGLFAPVPEFDWEQFDNAGKGDRVTINETDMADIFENGAKQLTKAGAARMLMESGAGKTAAYATLKLDGRFAGRLTEANGMLSWK